MKKTNFIINSFFFFCGVTIVGALIFLGVKLADKYGAEEVASFSLYLFIPLLFIMCGYLGVIVFSAIREHRMLVKERKESLIP